MVAKIKKIKTKNNKDTIMLVLNNGAHAIAVFDKDIICNLLDITYRDYWDIVKNTEPFEVVFDILQRIDERGLKYEDSN